MENKLISEEILRAKLLMGYNPTKTLTENSLLVNDETKNSAINEQKSVTAFSFLKGLVGQGDRAAVDALRRTGSQQYLAGKTLLDDIIRDFGPIQSSKASGGFLRNADDVIEALLNKTLSKTEINSLAKNMLKSGKISGPLKTTLVKTAGKNMLDDVRYAGMSMQEVEKALIKKGYEKNTAREIAKEFEILGGTSGKSAQRTTRSVSGGSYGRGKSKSDFQKWRQSMGEGWRSLTLWQKVKRIALAVAATGAGVGLLYWFFKEEAPQIFPDCLTQKMSDEDVIKMSKEELSFIIISKTGVRELDVNGGIKLFANKKCVSLNGKFEGSWEESGNQVVITLGGRKIVIPCVGGQGDGDDGGSGTSDYYECTTEPFRLYCKNDTYISKLQECLNKNGAGLNVDGDFGPKTLEALTKIKGYEQFDGNSELKISEIDKICGIVSTTTSTGQEGSTSTGETNKPKIGTFNPIPEG